LEVCGLICMKPNYDEIGIKGKGTMKGVPPGGEKRKWRTAGGSKVSRIVGPQYQARRSRCARTPWWERGKIAIFRIIREEQVEQFRREGEIL